MYENYVKQYYYDAKLLDPAMERSFDADSYAVPIPGGRAMVDWGMGAPVPLWYSGWRDETLAWHLTCSFHAHLNPSPVTVVRGPEAKKFLSENFVNNIENFPIGIIKHGVMCLENGLMATHGLMLRSGGDEYEAFWHAPYIDYVFSKKKYDAELIDKTMERFVFQLQGPKSLEIVEAVTGDDLHDLEYRHFRNSSIDGNWVRIIRFGMSGGLGYEIHGQMEHVKETYKKIMDVGAPLGIRPIGEIAYGMNHTPGGFVQEGLNICAAAGGFVMGLSFAAADKGFLEWQKANGMDAENWFMSGQQILPGSVGNDIEKRMHNPIEVGLGRCINWKHDFTGKEALRKIKENRTRNIVTLEWNPEDLGEIYMSQFRPGEDPYKPLDTDEFERALVGLSIQSTDYVLDADGNEIGVSFGRTPSEYHHAMISMATISLEYCELGKEVYVLWGEPGTRQYKIRAKVAPFPYNTHLENATFDVETIPHPAK